MKFFKKHKTKNIEKSIAFEVLSKICEKIKDDFNYLYLQFEEGIVSNVSEVSSYKKGYRNFIFNLPILHKYEKREEENFIIDDIYISDIENKKYKISVDITRGVFSGYLIEVDDIRRIDTTTIDVENLKIKSYENNFSKLFNNEELKYLNLNSIHEVVLENKTYYYLFNLEDGDFIGMDADKKVYEITHNPYEVILIDNNLLTFLKSKSN